MAAALALLLIGSLLQGSQCGEFQAFMPQTIKVLSGSCVTIPCSFDVPAEYESNIDNTCRAIWTNAQKTVFNSRDPQTTTNNGKLRGDLTNKDCTTTMNNMLPADSSTYIFRLECENALKWSFDKQTISISVTADPPRPTLTPSAVKEKEGTSVSLTCSAPAPCLSHPPTLTWSDGLGHSVETLQENQDQTNSMTSVVTFTVSHNHHGKTISCTAAYKKQDGSTESAVSTSSTADISFAPQILPSSDCIKAADQLNCSCRTVGNPSPTLRWYLDGAPVNHSDEFVTSEEHLNDTSLWSIITVNGPRERDLSSLLCRSSNSLGSASQRFCVNSLEPQMSAQSQDRVMLPVFISTVAALLVLVCVLLFVNRAQKTRHDLLKSQCTGGTSTVTVSHLLASGEGNEVPNTTEEDIYVNKNALTHPATLSEPNSTTSPSSRPNNAEGASKSSEKTNEEGKDVIYSTVNWKTKSKKKKAEDSMDMHQPGSSYLEEETCVIGGKRRSFVSNSLEMESLYDNVQPRNVEKEVESEYAQVKFKDKRAMRK